MLLKAKEICISDHSWRCDDSESKIDEDAYSDESFILHQMKAEINLLQAKSKVSKRTHVIANIMRFRLYEVNLDLTCESHQNTSKTYFMNILRCFDDH